MSAPKPIGFDNWKAHFFLSKDGSGNKFWVKGSFCLDVSSRFRIFRGPSIAKVSASYPCIVTTTEAHGFHDNQNIRIHGMPDNLSVALNKSHMITRLSDTTFSVNEDTTGTGVSVTAGSFVVGKQYTITSLGTTNFTAIGASGSPAVGEVFTATGAGTGSGTAERSVEGVGVAGADIGSEILTADYTMTPGRLCIEDYPDAWELPFEG